MTMLWIATSASLLLALLAWGRSRRTAKRLEQLSQMYWELKYQHGELRVQVQRLTTPGAPSSHAPAPQPQAGESFVPLTSLKR